MICDIDEKVITMIMMMMALLIETYAVNSIYLFCHHLYKLNQNTVMKAICKR